MKVTTMAVTVELVSDVGPSVGPSSSAVSGESERGRGKREKKEGERGERRGREGRKSTKSKHNDKRVCVWETRKLVSLIKGLSNQSTYYHS